MQITWNSRCPSCHWRGLCNSFHQAIHSALMQWMAHKLEKVEKICHFYQLLLLQTSIPPKDSTGGKQFLGANNDLAAVPFQFEVDSAKGIPKMASKTVDLC